MKTKSNFYYNNQILVEKKIPINNIKKIISSLDNEIAGVKYEREQIKTKSIKSHINVITLDDINAGSNIDISNYKKLMENESIINIPDPNGLQQDCDTININPSLIIKLPNEFLTKTIGKIPPCTESLQQIVPTNSFDSTDLKTMQAAHVEITDRFQVYRRIAMSAARQKKLYTIYGHYPKVRESLMKRGWIEKCSPNHLKSYKLIPQKILISYATTDNKYKTAAMSKFVTKFPPNFIWQYKSNCLSNNIHNTDNILQYRNRIYRTAVLDFTTKKGLIGCIENSHWNIIDGVSEIRIPRFHCLATPEDETEFLRDYNTTYCLSLLKYITSKLILTNIFKENGDLSIDIIKFAIGRIQSEILYYTNSDFGSTLLFEILENGNWQQFYENVKKLINGTSFIKETSYSEMKNVYDDCCILMMSAMKYWPTLSSDGFNNLWILKPSYSCRGHGIVIKRSYLEIVGYAKTHPNMQYIVQKYIERPLLIYKTKFDIRQYVLLTITENKFNMWIYKDCYLRFSSQEYTLSNLNESFHITNNSVQKKYRNGKRNEELPTHNMWSLDQFQLYLSNQTVCDENIWHNKIYAGMKKNVIAIVLASLEETDFKRNTFELYGCDFMLDENYEPILIEINSTPDMSSSTPVTAKICPQTLEDVIKVVVDLPKNLKSDTGKFELIYNINIEMPLISTEMQVIGQQMFLNKCLVKCKPKIKKTKQFHKKIIHNHNNQLRDVDKLNVDDSNNNNNNKSSNNTSTTRSRYVLNYLNSANGIKPFTPMQKIPSNLKSVQKKVSNSQVNNNNEKPVEKDQIEHNKLYFPKYIIEKSKNMWNNSFKQQLMPGKNLIIIPSPEKRNNMIKDPNILAQNPNIWGDFIETFNDEILKYKFRKWS